MDRDTVIRLAVGWTGKPGLPIIRDASGRATASWFTMGANIGVIAPVPSNVPFHGMPASYALDEEYRGDTNPLDRGAPKSKKAEKK